MRISGGDKCFRDETREILRLLVQTPSRFDHVVSQWEPAFTLENAELEFEIQKSRYFSELVPYL